ncbi:MAG: InlB B-repeat-containing protein, partial [Firmicutes bacterium]|nr:InlB B-repeat-containing protein [Bacillota bacterium]
KIILGPNFKEIKESMKLGNMRNGWRNINNYSVKLSNGYYAVFTNIGLNAYTNNLVSSISFYKGEGSGTMPLAYEATGFKYTLPECGFTAPSGYVFDGWELNGTKYNTGDKIIVSENITLTAKYKLNYHYVRYYQQSGSTQYKQNVINHGVTTSLLTYESCDLTPPAYKVFDYWEIDGEKYAPGDKITVTKDIDIYAVYKDRLFAVTFDTAGLCTPPETQYLPYGGTVSDPGIPFAKGYTFVGWYSDNSFKDIYKISDFGNSMYAVKGDTVYYACFKEAVDDYVEVTGFDTNIHSGMNYYTKDILSVPEGVNYHIGSISWYAADGSWTNSSSDNEKVSFTAGKDYYAEILILPNSGLTFGIGTINDKLVSLNDGQSLIDFDNSTFGSYSIYLRTKPVTALGSCEVSFMANGGTGNMDDVKVAQGAGFILPECAFTAPEGKYFVGWTRSNVYFEFEPVGDMMDAGEKVTPTANNMFFFAQWADKGDINADGVVNNVDAAYLLKYICGKYDLTDGKKEMSKMNSDSKIDMLDVIAILKIAE